VENLAEDRGNYLEDVPPVLPAGHRSVSVVTVSFYTGTPLYEAIPAILAQPEVGEVIVVNNGNSSAVLNWLGVLARADNRVQVVSGHGNIGFAAGCNLGAGLAKGKYLLLVNPDCILPAGGLAVLLRDGLSSGGKWMIGGRLLDQGGSEQSGSRREVLTPWRALVETTRLYRWSVLYKSRLNVHQEPLPLSTVPVPVISGACMLLPLDAYRGCGGMDEGYFLHVEDIDFCVRFRKEGGRVLFCPHASLLHYKGSSGGNPMKVEWHKARSFIRYFYGHFAKSYPPGILTLVSAGILTRFTAMLLLHILRRKKTGALAPQVSRSG
jgi:GT2 family glycosyltransferase